MVAKNNCSSTLHNILNSFLSKELRKSHCHVFLWYKPSLWYDRNDSWGIALAVKLELWPATFCAFLMFVCLSCLWGLTYVLISDQRINYVIFESLLLLYKHCLRWDIMYKFKHELGGCSFFVLLGFFSWSKHFLLNFIFKDSLQAFLSRLISTQCMSCL